MHFYSEGQFHSTLVPAPCLCIFLEPVCTVNRYTRVAFTRFCLVSGYSPLWGITLLNHLHHMPFSQANGIPTFTQNDLASSR
jgi:hypothetical protein